MTAVKSQTFLKDQTGIIKKIKESDSFFLVDPGGGAGGRERSVSSGSYCCEKLKRDVQHRRGDLGRGR